MQLNGVDGMYEVIHECRICGSKELAKYLNFGLMPLANAYIDPKIKQQEYGFPLEVLFCKNCALSQLSIVVAPKIMFSNYAYHSSISRTFREHCSRMADTVKKMLKTESPFVVDIASNDGCLIREFKKKNFRVVGVEPAGNLAAIANKEGLKTIVEFWNREVAERIKQEMGGADAITATNVFAHVHDVKSFIKDANYLLKDDGVLIIEVPYGLNLIKRNEFDTIYHEHLSYFLVKPLQVLFSNEGMELRDVQEVPIHGGTIRVFATKKENKLIPKNAANVDELLGREKEEGLYSVDAYNEFVKNLLDIKIELLKLLAKLKREKKRIAAYGASAKGNTLLNYCGINSNLVDFIVDDTPEKQDKLYAGNHIPIFGREELERQKPDYLIILAWNFSGEIMEKTKKFSEHGGKYIIPIPEVRVVAADSFSQVSTLSKLPRATFSKKVVTKGGFSPTFSKKVEGEAGFSPTFSKKVV